MCHTSTGDCAYAIPPVRTHLPHSPLPSPASAYRSPPINPVSRLGLEQEHSMDLMPEKLCTVVNQSEVRAMDTSARLFPFWLWSFMLVSHQASCPF